MGERASQGELSLPWLLSPPQHLPAKHELTPSPCSEWRDSSFPVSTSAKGDGYLAQMKVRDRVEFYRTHQKHQIHPVCSARRSYWGHPFLTMLSVFTAATPTFRAGRVTGGRLGRWTFCFVLPVFQTGSFTFSKSVYCEKSIDSFLQTRLILFTSTKIIILAVYDS